MKLTEEQKQEKLARANIKRLVNRVASEFSFKKWKDYHSYLHSMGFDESFISKQANVDLNRQQLDELLSKYEDEALKSLSVKAGAKNADSSTSRTERETKPENSPAIQQAVSSAEKKFNETEEKFEASNNYGLSKSPNEKATLLWFQKKAAVELLKDILL